MRAENSEMSASLRRATKTTNKHQSMISSGTELRARLNHENERFRETVRQEESTMQARLRGAEMYHYNIVTNKDGEAQTLRDQMQTEGRIAPICRKATIKLQITSEARTQLSDVENRAKLEVDRLRDHLNREETTASSLQSALSEARKESHGVPVSDSSMTVSMKRAWET